MNWLSAAWAWGVLAILVVLYVVAFDLHAAITHTQTMSGQFRAWLLNPTIGPIIFAVWVGIFAGLTFHWFEYKGRLGDAVQPA